ncbi:MAG: radical SAM protein, partial [Treponema sp.]|nr:radical SAM protein [Treponema sp.]
MKPLEAVLIKTSLVDFPERVAAACFLRGCNLRCPYCYNTELVAPQNISKAQDAAESGNQSKAQDAGGDDCSQAQKSGAQAKRDQPQFVSIQDIIAHLKKRANVLSGFVISGGEPLLNPDIVQSLILEARSLGYKIKLDTNGMFPGRLQELLSNPACAPDYVALDVKTSPARYSELQAQDAGGQDCSQDLNAAAGSLACNASQAQDAGGDDCSQAQKSGAQAKRD